MSDGPAEQRTGTASTGTAPTGTAPTGTAPTGTEPTGTGEAGASTEPEAARTDQAERAMGFALALGQRLFEAGAETSAVDAALASVAAAYGPHDDLQVDITARTITLYHRPAEGRPTSMTRVTRTDESRSLDGLNRLYRLVLRIRSGRLPLARAERLLADSDRLSRRPWIAGALGGATLAASISLQAGGTAGAVVTAFVLQLLSGRLGWLLGRAGLQPFYLSAAQGAATVGACTLLLQLDVLTGREAVAAAAAVLVLLLPILSVVSLAEDAVNGYALMAASRLITVATLFAGLLGGTALAGLAVRDWADSAHYVHFAALTPPVVLLASAVGAAGNAAFNGGGPRLLLPATAAGLVAGAANLVLHTALPVPVAPAAFCSSALLALLAALVAPRLHLTPTVMILCGITGALLPGPAVFQSLAAAAARTGGAGAGFASALLTTTSLGFGAVLGTTLGLRLLAARSRTRPAAAAAPSVP
ncbi:threonine/serine exporter family protein [Kitasatospora sp. NPDC090308]|uniref:threonine/serine exporter family protein n=1 Tax=Kitasatospora sp. NPDC090308 TaxID=3364082 RepID=UPI00380CEE12